MVIYDIRYKPNVSAAASGNAIADRLQASSASKKHCSLCTSQERMREMTNEVFIVQQKLKFLNVKSTK